MVKRIIFLVQNNFTLRDYKRYGIELLQKNGFYVEVWRVPYPPHLDVLRNHAPLDLFAYDRLILFNNRFEAYTKLSKLSHTDFVINLLNYDYWNVGIYRALSRSDANYAVTYTGAIPYPVIKEGVLHFLMKKIKELASLRYLKAWRRLFIKLPARCLGVKAASLMLVGGERCSNYKYYFKYPIDNNTEVLYIHAFDYDLYLEEKDSPCVDTPTAVFIEDFFPSDPDYVILDGEFPFDVNSYYQLLNNFFDLVEQKMGLEVVIAAHPRSNYAKHPEYFKGRKYLRAKTVKLVKECKLVMTHCSTAVSFANLFYKPVIFITRHDLDDTYKGCQIMKMARGFGKNPIFIDTENNIDWERELMVSKAHYDNYRTLYIKIENSENLPFWQVVTGRLKKGF